VALVVGTPIYAFVQYLLTKLTENSDGPSVIGWLGVLAAGGLGAMLGACVAQGARWGHVRNPNLVRLLAGGMGLIAVYVSWVLWIQFLSGFWVFSPVSIVKLLFEDIEQGVTNTIATLMEVLFVVGGAWFMVQVMWPSRLFCERCEEWTQRIKVDPLAPLENPEAIVEGLKAGNAFPVEQLRRSEGGGPFAEIQLNSCPTCNRLHAMTMLVTTAVQEVDKKGRKKGKKQKQTQTVLENVIVDKATAEAVRTLEI